MCKFSYRSYNRWGLLISSRYGGAEFVFSGENDSNIMHNSALINLHVCDICVKKK